MFSYIKKALLTTLILLFSTIVYADDIDILYANDPVDTNILFVMDLSSSMDLLIEGEEKTRLQGLSGALNTIVSNEKFENVNFGVSVFSGINETRNYASGISFPISPAKDVKAQDILSSTGFNHSSETSVLPDAGDLNTKEYISLFASSWKADGRTPLVDALYEAAIYFRGEDVHWGRHPAINPRSAHPSTYNYTAPNGNFTYETVLVSPARTEYQEHTRPIDTGGINCRTNTDQVCSTYRHSSCGLGTNCTIEVDQRTRWCEDNEAQSDCSNRHPTWYDFSPFTDIKCTTDAEGLNAECNETTTFKALEDVNKTTCDAQDTYTCDFLVDIPAIYEEQVIGDAKYNSPIVEECPANAIILLTDGEPSANRSIDLIAPMIGSYANGCNILSGDIDETGSKYCGVELAEFLSSEDQSESIPGLQNVETYAVGFALSGNASAITYLNDIAKAGDINKKRKALIADDEAQLVKAFTDAITGTIEAKARTFSSPSFTVDTSTSLTNGPYVYIPVFDRDMALWPGNLKKYKLDKGVLVDADGKPALDENNTLLDTARDLWSAVASEDSITSGGVANKINPDTRKVLTDDGDGLIPLSNTIDNELFGLGDTDADDDLKDNLVKFIIGTNPEDDSKRAHMGDIIHSKPVQLTFASGRKTIFVGTNEGFLHAINDYADEGNAKNGTEAFVYMPKTLLKNINTQYSGITQEEHIYGVDSPISLWIDESESTNQLNLGNNVVDAGEKAYLFFGLRRGGNTYSALDVTDPDDPELLWSKSFDSANSWSQPVVASLKWGDNDNAKPVLIMGGGFTDDESGTEQEGGNNVYIIDAIVGTVVWDANDAFDRNNVTNFTGNELPNAVPAKVRAIDLDRNNSVDRLYFGDTGANIWRVDLNAANYDDLTTNDNDIKEATIHRIAELGGNGTNNRQFFEELDVAIFKKGGSLVASIAVGSGSRPNPLSTNANDYFFAIFDTEVTTVPATKELIKFANLQSATISDGSQYNADFKGWKFDLNSSTGEKVLTSALTFQGKVLFSSFAKVDDTSVGLNHCAPAINNENKLYVLDLFAGSEDFSTIQPGGEILDTPKIIYPPIEKCEKGDCKRDTKISIGKTIIDFPAPKDHEGKPITDIFGNPISGASSALERVYWINK